MAYKRILTIQDISCVGQCSMTVALPILSACGHETCILPSAVLSTHTGGFGKPVIRHMTDAMGDMMAHWRENEITFDAILVGYLGSMDAVELVLENYASLLGPEGILIVDPAMADHGRMYSGLDEAYALAMERLCRKADIILPNLTEAALFARVPYREEITEVYAAGLLEKLEHPCAVLTGVGFRPEETGILVRRDGKVFHHPHRRLPGSCHGTGDIFAACFTGALLQGKTMEDAVGIAGDIVCRCMEITREAPAHWYGVRFETALPELIRRLQE